MISQADHMVCNLTPYESMAQRLGRVNRRGDGKAEIDVIYETDPDPRKKDDDLEKARWKTLDALKRLPKCQWSENCLEASPYALSQLIATLTEDERKATFSPQPTILPTSDILFDAWALTTIREKLPGRPPVEPYLHGISDWEPPQTKLAWREEVWKLGRKFESVRERMLFQKYVAELLDDYPLKTHETLVDRVGPRLQSPRETRGPTRNSCVDRG